MKNYTSEVSPDRKGIITSGLKAVSRNRHNVLKPIDFVATLLEGKVKYQKLPSGNSEYIEFYDKNGEMVATYSNNGSVSYTHLDVYKRQDVDYLKIDAGSLTSSKIDKEV